MVLALASLINLTGLFLSDNPVSDITPLANLTEVTSLSLARTGMGNISPLAALNSLTYLNPEGNEIRDISPLGGNSDLGKGVDVRLQGNDLHLRRCQSSSPVDGI